MRTVALALAILGTSGCVIAPRSLAMPDNTETTVALLTGNLPPPLDVIARHPWFAVRRAGETEWHVYEVPSSSIEADPFTGHEPYLHPVLHRVWRGEEAERAATCLEAKARPWIHELHYVFYPGPNSNTFGAAMLRACNLHASLPATSVGKDWHGLVGGGVTTEGTGLELQTAVGGVRIGLQEGLQIQVLGIEVGIDLWPPALIVPFGPGRLGFADR